MEVTEIILKSLCQNPQPYEGVLWRGSRESLGCWLRENHWAPWYLCKGSVNGHYSDLVDVTPTLYSDCTSVNDCTAESLVHWLSFHPHAALISEGIAFCLGVYSNSVRFLLLIIERYIALVRAGRLNKLKECGHKPVPQWQIWGLKA